MQQTFQNVVCEGERGQSEQNTVASTLTDEEKHCMKDQRSPKWCQSPILISSSNRRWQNSLSSDRWSLYG